MRTGIFYTLLAAFLLGGLFLSNKKFQILSTSSNSKVSEEKGEILPISEWRKTLIGKWNYTKIGKMRSGEGSFKYVGEKIYNINESVFYANIECFFYPDIDDISDDSYSSVYATGGYSGFLEIDTTNNCFYENVRKSNIEIKTNTQLDKLNFDITGDFKADFMYEYPSKFVEGSAISERLEVFNANEIVIIGKNYADGLEYKIRYNKIQ